MLICICIRVCFCVCVCVCVCVFVCVTGFRQDFSSNSDKWKEIYDAPNPQAQPFAGRWEKQLSGLQRLCTLRVIRPDKVVLAIQTFVVDVMTDKYVKPPGFDLQVVADCL